MMFHDGWGFFGMHALWWLFWIILLVSFFSLLTPVPRDEARRRRQTPLEILQRRYAAGEISTQEYDERKAKLELDSSTQK
jgi:putative membrane protein